MGLLTEHLTLYEARCRCGCGIEKLHVPELTAQAQVLEALRADLNADPELEQYKPPGGEIRLIPMSWVRCDKHNTEVGGVALSRHRAFFCDATDISSPELPEDLLHEKAAKYFTTAIHYLGRYFVHVDRRAWPDGEVHAWVKEPSETVLPGEARA